MAVRDRFCGVVLTLDRQVQPLPPSITSPVNRCDHDSPGRNHYRPTRCDWPTRHHRAVGAGTARTVNASRTDNRLRIRNGSQRKKYNGKCQDFNFHRVSHNNLKKR